VPNYTYPDVDPDQAAIKNRLGVQTHDALEAFSAPLVAARISELGAGHGPTGTLDAAHLNYIHRHLFQDVYEWPGRTRDEKVRLADGTVATEPVIRKADGKPFMLGARIPGALQAISDRLRKANHLRGLSRDAFATQAADIMASINAIHAFREGNGRTQRAFIRTLAKAAGHTLDFTVISQERMIQASIAANEREDPTVMRRLFADATNPARIAALRRVIAFFVRQ
jgi:cell filamentation protein